MIEYILAITAGLFSIANPIGAVPLYLSLTSNYTYGHRLKVCIQISLFSLGILMVFFWGGIYLLDFFGININALRIAGGLVILHSGFGLLSGSTEESRAIDKKVMKDMESREDIAFTPMAMPMIAGPGSISYLINLYTQTSAPVEKLHISLAILVLCVLIFVVLRFSTLLYKILGRSGIRALARIMGFLVMAIATQYIITGVVELTKTL